MLNLSGSNIEPAAALAQKFLRELEDKNSAFKIYFLALTAPSGERVDALVACTPRVRDALLTALS
jgi:HEAT repeat protein